MFRKIILLWFMVPAMSSLANDIPRPIELEPAVQFWIKVYTQVSTQQGYIHDDSNLNVIYETLTFPPGSSSVTQNRKINAALQQYQQALTRLANGKRTGLNALETRVLEAWPSGTGSKDFKLASENVRFQRGQSDRFKEGLARSGQWKPYIRSMLAKYQLPTELEVLPHVESSFNPKAYSKVAAAGMWQFMPGTAKQFMQVDYIVDQRMDPYISTEAAARLLQRNYQITGSWPLALTAYNFGTGGIVRASKAMGTKDISKIVHHYRGPNFGFASRNFYASFLASLEIDRNASKYFNNIKLAPPLDYDTTVTRHFLPATAVANSMGLSLETLREHNPSLLQCVWSGQKHIPKGFELRLPKSTQKTRLDVGIAAIPSAYLFSQQVPDVTHRIVRGETLSTIAQRYHTRVSTLMSLNSIREAHKIRAGQTLRLPGVNGAPTVLATTMPATTRVAATSTSTSTSTSTIVPVASITSDPEEYIVKNGDSLWAISRNLGISQHQLISQNNLSSNGIIKPGQRLKIVSNENPTRESSYVIQSGDSLWKIARRFNLSEAELAAWNGLKNQHQIKVGQVLRLAAAF